MTSMSQVIILFRLQKIDTQRDQIASRLAEIQNLLNSNQIIQHAQEILAQAEQSLQTTHQSLKAIEDTVQTQRNKLEQNEGALYGGKIHIPKELQDLQNEVASLKKHLSTLEDQQFEVMMALEQSEADHNSALELMHSAQAQFAQQKASLLGEQMTLTKELNRLDAERQATVAPVSPENLKIYEHLRLQKHGVAIASLSDDACDACGATLTPAEKQIARSPSQIFICPSCGRILYAG